jgi:hypothetical protein
VEVNGFFVNSGEGLLSAGCPHSKNSVLSMDNRAVIHEEADPEARTRWEVTTPLS